MIVGLSGFARAGKDTVAERLVSEHEFTRIAFADKLRDFLYALNPVVKSQKFTNYGYRRLSSVIDEFGWDGYKETEYSDEIRSLLQRLGTEAGRQVMWDTIWIDAALKDLDPEKNYVITDARFLNEFSAITDRGGEIWRVNRRGVGPANDHASETEALQYNDFSMFINNDGTIRELFEEVDVAYNYALNNKE